MYKLSTLALLLGMPILEASAQTGIPNNDMETEARKMWEATLYGGLYINNEQAWQLEPSISWKFHKYIGVNFGIEFTSQYNQPGRSIRISGYDAELDENERNVGWVIFKPSVTFRSPVVWKSKDRFYRLWFQLSPGISLACPLRNSLAFDIVEYHGMIGNTVDYQRFPNRGLQWFYWNARASINFAIDRVIIGAGYYISNLDYYSGRRNVELPNNQRFYVPAKEVSQSVYLSVGYCF